MIHFVTDTYLKNNTPITKNVSSVELMVYIEPASMSWMRFILGGYFYDYLLAKYNAQTLTTNEEILVAKMQPAIAWRASYDCVIGLTYQLKNKGLQKQNGDNSESVELTEAQFVARHYEQKAELFESIVRSYLKSNKDLFPTYTSKENNDCENRPQDDDNFNGDMFFA